MENNEINEAELSEAAEESADETAKSNIEKETPASIIITILGLLTVLVVLPSLRDIIRVKNSDILNYFSNSSEISGSLAIQALLVFVPPAMAALVWLVLTNRLNRKLCVLYPAAYAAYCAYTGFTIIRLMKEESISLSELLGSTTTPFIAAFLIIGILLSIAAIVTIWRTDKPMPYLFLTFGGLVEFALLVLQNFSLLDFDTEFITSQLIFMQIVYIWAFTGYLMMFLSLKFDKPKEI